jgi:hypothetical protein
MKKKLVLGSLTLGAALLAGLVGLLLTLNETDRENLESSYDELSGEPLGI